MKSKIILVSVLVLCAVINLTAAEVKTEKAALVAKNIYFEKANQYHNLVNFDDIRIEDSFVKGNEYFVFTFTGDGFVIVSADDAISPVIGYSITGFYNNEDQPDAYRNFMQTYVDAIQYVREKGIQPSDEIVAQWTLYSSETPIQPVKAPGSKSVNPLLQCKWNQSSPYNAWCPEDENGPGGHVYAGCVATAMSQVMYYWRYPLQGTGSHTYYYPPYGSLSANFGTTTYNWEGMQNSIDHGFPGPIAELQYHCGIAVDMMYGPNGSGAYSDDVPPALENYFGYDSDCYFTWKDNYSNSAWVDMLQENLDNSWPMYYSGFSSAGGHAFVCDGYQDENFHFNFGWGGSSDGFYTLLSVNGFNDGQGAVFDTYPEGNYPYFFTGDHTITLKSGSITDGSGPVENYQNNTTSSWLFDPQTTEDSVSNIKIVFQYFETAENDFVTIYNGPTVQDEVIGSFSGNALPPAVTSTSNKVLVVFTTDGSGTAQGWLAEFTAIIPDFCKGVVMLSDLYGSVTDGSADFNYQNTSVCMWKIEPPQATSVTLNFTAFDTEADNDRVRIYDVVTQELLAEYSGSYPSASMPAPVTSYSGKMFIAFSSNASITGTGWEANYTTVTTGIETNLSGGETFSVTPNPAKDMLTLRFSSINEGTSEIRLLSLSGVTMLSESLNNDDLDGNYSMDISRIPDGVYLLQITARNGSEFKKIVVQ